MKSVSAPFNNTDLNKSIFILIRKSKENVAYIYSCIFFTSNRHVIARKQSFDIGARHSQPIVAKTFSGDDIAMYAHLLYPPNVDQATAPIIIVKVNNLSGLFANNHLLSIASNTNLHFFMENSRTGPFSFINFAIIFVFINKLSCSGFVFFLISISHRSAVFIEVISTLIHLFIGDFNIVYIIILLSFNGSSKRFRIDEAIRAGVGNFVCDSAKQTAKRHSGSKTCGGHLTAINRVICYISGSTGQCAPCHGSFDTKRDASC